jgi:glycosyltransferase involved in cell wall biosynthesis
MPSPTSPAVSPAALHGVSIVLPAFNEEAILASTIDVVIETFRSFGAPFEIIIVDDGSTDRTAEVCRELAERHPGEVRLERHAKNQGIGAALKTGFSIARFPVLTNCSADTPYRPEDIRPFMAALGRADTIVGVRTSRTGYNALMRFNSWLYVRLVRLFFGLRLRDVNWTCFYRADLIRRIDIREAGIPMLLEVLVALRDMGGTFHEVEVVQPPREGGTPSAARLRVMWQTGLGFFRVWRRRRR